MENDKTVESTEQVTKDEEDSKTTETKATDKVPEKTFTQAQVNKMMAKEKGQGKASALSELGIDPKDGKTTEMLKEFFANQKTDTQKESELRQQEVSRLEEANRRVMIAESKAEAMLLGVKPKYVDDVVTLALSKFSDDSDLKTIIGEYKTKYPIWFGDTEENEKENVGKKGTGSSIKTGVKDADTKKDGLGSRLAAKRRTDNVKKTSYWGKKV